MYMRSAKNVQEQTNRQDSHDAQSERDKPREKLEKKGAAALSDVELLQVVIGSGGIGNDYRQIAKNLNQKVQTVGISDLTLNDVRAIKGVGIAKATRIFAALEFCRRKFVKQDAPLIDTPAKAAEQLGFIKDRKQEHFVLITLNGARRLINTHVIFIGTLTASLAHPREIFSVAIEERAASIIIAHNHPSGVLDVSGQDREVSERIKQAGELLGIRLDDHLIVAGDDFVSAM